jgi:hypothetical protein
MNTPATERLGFAVVDGMNISSPDSSPSAIPTHSRTSRCAS